MSFDFFNSSYLAFGSKITRAFKSLAQMLDESTENVDYLIRQLSVYNFSDKNYKIGFPTSETRGVQGQQIFNVLNSQPTIIKNIAINEQGGLTVSFITINKNKITVATGDSGNLTWGWVLVTLTNTNNSIEKTLRFTQEEPGDTAWSNPESVVFKFRIENNRINLSELNSAIPLYASNYDNHYVDMTLTQVDKGVETVGYQTYLMVSGVTSGYKDSKVDNNKTHMTESYGSGYSFTNIAYTFDGEVVGNNDNVERVYRIDYISSRNKEVNS